MKRLGPSVFFASLSLLLFLLSPRTGLAQNVYGSLDPKATGAKGSITILSAQDFKTAMMSLYQQNQNQLRDQLKQLIASKSGQQGASGGGTTTGTASSSNAAYRQPASQRSTPPASTTSNLNAPPAQSNIYGTPQQSNTGSQSGVYSGFQGGTTPTNSGSNNNDSSWGIRY